MNYRSTLMTASAAVALAGLANAQVNGDYDHNWASLSSGPAAFVFGPGFFGQGDPNDPIGPGDAIRNCYSIDVTQGGRNESGNAFISWFDVAQAFGGNNSTLGVDIGITTITSLVSDDLGDDACLSDFFATTGTAYNGGVINLGQLGLIAGTGPYSLNQGFFWNIAFEFIGTNLPSVGTTAGVDPVAVFPDTPLLTHLLFEVQGPVDEGPLNKQYFLSSSSELNGINPAGSGGVTNGNNLLGFNQYGANAEVSGAVQGSRVTLGNTATGTLLGGTVTNVTGGDLEFLGALALQTPYLSGSNNGNTGGGGADWIISGGSLSTLDVRVQDKLAGAQGAASGSAIADPGLLFNAGFILWSSTPAVLTLQNALSWDDLGGGAPPKAGTYLIPPLFTQRQGNQTLHVNFDGTTAAFLNLAGFGLLSEFTPAFDPNLDGAAGNADLFVIQNPTSGISSLITGPVSLATPNPSQAGKRLGIHALGIQINAATGGALEYTELTNARTVVFQ